MTSKAEAKKGSERRGRPSLIAAAGKRRAIVQAATDLFLRSGYKDVSIREIAHLADVSTRTVFNMFEGKERLLRACLQEVAQHQEQPVLAEQATLLDTIETFATNMLEILSRAESVSFAQLVMRDGRDMPEIVVAARENQELQFVQPLTTYLGGHLPTRVEAEALAKIYISMAISEWQRSVTFLLPLPDERQRTLHVARVARMFVKALNAD